MNDAEPRVYLPNPNVWAPTPGYRLFAVLAPQDQTEISTKADYKELLMDRVRWLIEQHQDEQQQTVEETLQLIERLIRREGLGEAEIYLPWASLETPSGEPISPESAISNWSRCLIDNPWMMTKWNLEVSPNYEFPLSVETDPQEKEDLIWLIGDTSLEEWAISLTMPPQD